MSDENATSETPGSEYPEVLGETGALGPEALPETAGTEEMMADEENINESGGRGFLKYMNPEFLVVAIWAGTLDGIGIFLALIQLVGITIPPAEIISAVIDQVGLVSIGVWSFFRFGQTAQKNKFIGKGKVSAMTASPQKPNINAQNTGQVRGDESSPSVVDTAKGRISNFLWNTLLKRIGPEYIIESIPIVGDIWPGWTIAVFLIWKNNTD